MRRPDADYNDIVDVRCLEQDDAVLVGRAAAELDALLRIERELGPGRDGAVGKTALTGNHLAFDVEAIDGQRVGAGGSRDTERCNGDRAKFHHSVHDRPQPGETVAGLIGRARSLGLDLDHTGSRGLLSTIQKTGWRLGRAVSRISTTIASPKTRRPFGTPGRYLTSATKGTV